MNIAGTLPSIMWICALYRGRGGRARWEVRRKGGWRGGWAWGPPCEMDGGYRT